MNDYIKISIGLHTEMQSDILIALLSESGFEGFEEEAGVLHAFISQEKYDEEQLKSLLENFSTDFSKQIIKQKNWNEEWEKSFDPVMIDNFCTIRANFHQPVSNITHEIIITPKMSFGTGHHATTFLMIQAMREINFRNKSVLDFGTGTGVLAILAEKLGASEIVAIDNDDWSVENARENISVNRSLKIIVEKNDRVNSLKKYDIILANINKHIILGHLAEMKQQLASQGVLIISGLLQQDGHEIKFELQKHGLEVIRQLEKDGWICLGLTIKP